MTHLVRLPFLCLLLAASLTSVSHAEPDFPPEIAKWEIVERPAPSNWEAHQTFFKKANASDHKWKVRKEGDKVVVAPDAWGAAEKKKILPAFDTTQQLSNRKAKAALAMKVRDGWIAAHNEGEFGSAVYWFNEDGSKSKKLSDHRINQFMTEGERIFAVEGLAHLGMSKGSMIEISLGTSDWRVSEFIPLPEAGQAIARISEGDYVIVTTSMLLRVNLNKELKIIVPNGEWPGLHANSVAVDSGNIYIGMRQFVARCKLADTVQPFDLLVPAKSWMNK